MYGIQDEFSRLLCCALTRGRWQHLGRDPAKEYVEALDDASANGEGTGIHERACLADGTLRGLPCGGVVPATYVYAASNSYNAWRWQSANVIPSDQAVWIARPNLGAANNFINDGRANAQAHFTTTRTGFLDYFDKKTRCCRQQCTPVGVGKAFYPTMSSKFYKIFQGEACTPLSAANAAVVNNVCTTVKPAFTGSMNVMDRSCSGAFAGPW